MDEESASDEEDEGTNDRTLMYYVNDGVYGSFNCILYDHAHCLPTLHKKPKSDEVMYPCSIWGPTCDGLDRIVGNVTCQTCRWATGWFSRTWAPTLWLPPPPSTASRDLTFTTSCPALPGNMCSRSVPRACQLLRRSPACLKCQPAVAERAAWRCPLS